jgi:hypothetical protein
MVLSRLLGRRESHLTRAMTINDRAPPEGVVRSNAGPMSSLHGSPLHGRWAMGSYVAAHDFSRNRRYELRECL